MSEQKKARFRVEVEFEVVLPPGYVLDEDGQGLADPTEDQLREYIYFNQGPFVALFNSGVERPDRYNEWYSVKKLGDGV